MSGPMASTSAGIHSRTSFLNCWLIGWEPNLIVCDLSCLVNRPRKRNILEARNLRAKKADSIVLLFHPIDHAPGIGQEGLQKGDGFQIVIGY